MGAMEFEVTINMMRQSTEKINSINRSMGSIKENVSNIHINLQSQNALYRQMNQRIAGLNKNMAQMMNGLSQMEKGLADAQILYLKCEESLVGESKNDKEQTSHSEERAGFDQYPFDGLFIIPLMYILKNVFKALGMFSEGGNFLGYEFPTDKYGITAWIGRVGGEFGNEDMHGSINGYLGKCNALWENEWSIGETKTERKYKNGRWTEEESWSLINGKTGGELSVSILSGEAEMETGDDMFGSEFSGNVSAGNASVKGEGELSVGEDGINANVSGELMVTALEGEVSGTLNILGIEITGTVGGYAGGAGVEGKIGIEDNKFVMEGGFAALLGLSGGIEIGLNDEGWDNFVDFVTFWD